MANEETNDRIVDFPTSTDIVTSEGAESPNVLTDADLSAAESSFEEAYKPLPEPLAMYRMKVFGASAVFILAGVLTAIYFKAFSPLILSACGIYFGYKGFAAARRYQCGKIREVPVICIGVTPAKIRDHLSLAFRTVGDPDTGDGQEFFKFQNYSKRSAGDFIVNQAYMIYYDVDNPQTLISYMHI